MSDHRNVYMVNGVLREVEALPVTAFPPSYAAAHCWRCREPNCLRPDGDRFVCSTLCKAFP